VGGRDKAGAGMNDALTAVLFLVVYLVGVASGILYMVGTTLRLTSALSATEEGRGRDEGMACFWKDDYR
jgi:hypothetical protein